MQILFVLKFEKKMKKVLKGTAIFFLKPQIYLLKRSLTANRILKYFFCYKSEALL